MSKVISEPSEPGSQNIGGSENLSLDSFVTSRLGAPVEIPPEEPPQEAIGDIPEEGEVAEQPEALVEEHGETKDTDADAEADSVLSQLNLEDLSEAEIDKLRDALKSKAVGRYGELTAKRKAAEEEAARYKARIAELEASKNPLEKEEVIENNPFGDVTTAEDLQKEYTTFGQTLEWAEDLLDEHSDSHMDDVVTTVDGKELTKREVRTYQKKARQAREKFLPARFKELQQAQQAEVIQQHMQERAQAELAWLSDEDSEARKEYDAVMADPRVKLIAERVPEVGPQLNYLLAHAVNSFKGGATAPPPVAKATKAAPPPSPAPPHNPASATTRGTERGDAQFKKQLSELDNRFQQTGAVQDFAKVRAAQIAKRRKL